MKNELVIKPNTSLKNKTGVWHVVRPITDHKICIGCALCSKICPEGCITMVDKSGAGNKKRPRTDYDYCKGCALCARECPVKAIKIVADY